MSGPTTHDTVIFCDFDGTITTRDTCDAVLTRFADPAWREVDERFHRGEIGSRECIVQQFKSIRETDDTVISFLLDTIQIDPDFGRFVRAIEEAGLPIFVLSDGFELNVDAILGAHGLGHLTRLSNRIRFTPEGPIVEFPYAQSGCIAQSGNCKCAHMEALKQGRRAVLIGDGYSDRCASRVADIIFAKRVLREHCAETGLAHIPFQTFGDILDSPEFAQLLNGAQPPVGGHDA